MRHLTSKTLSALLAQSTSAAAQAAAAANGAPTSLPIVSTTLVANEAIQAGDLVVQAGNGLAYWADDPALNNVARPTGLAADAINQYITPAITINSSLVPVEGAAVLASGNIVTVWGSGGALSFSIFTPAGVLVVGPVSVSGTFSGGITSMEVRALTSGGFVISEAYNSSGVYPRLFFFDANGNVIGSPVLLENADTSYNVSLAPLAGGLIAATWYTVVGKQVKVATFNSSGVQQGATAVIASPAGLMSDNSTNNGAAGQRYVRAVALPTGNLAVMYVPYDSTAQTASAMVGVFTPAGVAVSPFVSLANLTGVNNGSTYYSGWDLCVTNDGGFAAAFNSGTSATRYVYCAKYTALGALVGAVLNPQTASNPSSFGPPRIVPAGAAGYAVLWQAASALNYCVVGDAAALVFPVTVTPYNVSVPYNFDAVAVADGGIAVVWNAGTAGYFGRIAYVGGTWTVAAALTMVGPNFSGSSGNHRMLLAALTDAASTPGNGFACLLGIQGTSPTVTLQLVFSAILKRALVGVAQAAAAKGAVVKVQIRGTIPLRLTLQKPYSVDQTANVPPGQKMSAIGTQAVLTGLLP